MESMGGRIAHMMIFKKAVHIDRLLFESIYSPEYKNINRDPAFPVFSLIHIRALQLPRAH